MSAKPTTQVTPSAAPCTMRAANSMASESAVANISVEPARASMPRTSGSFRPVRSEIAPIGTETASSVTPNEANIRPIVDGLAPSRRAKSGSTGTQIE